MIKKIGIICLLISASMFMGFAPAPKDEVTLYGTYVWSNGSDQPSDLRAVFNQTAENKWNVAFFFKFRGQPHTYRGTATGSLKSGTLSGRVQNENGARTWVFDGNFTKGNFSGTHAEVYSGGEESPTGTLTLGPKKK